MTHNKLFIKVNNKQRTIKGKPETIATFRQGHQTYNIRVDESDSLIGLTISPEEYLTNKLVIPIGKRDSEGNPIYQILELNEKYIKKKC